MTDLALVTATKLRVVEPGIQLTGVAVEAIAIGDAVRLDTATGKFTKSNGSSNAEGRFYGIALRAAAAGEALTAMHRGVVDGFDLSALAYDAPVYLSDTDGKFADAPDTISMVVGRVIPGFATTLGTAADKMLMIEPATDSVIGAGDLFDVTYSMLANGSLADQTFYVANQAARVVAIREIHSVAGTDGGAVNLQVVKDAGTDAPGAGTNLLTNNASAGFNLKGTANTVQAGTLDVDAAVTLAAGDRLAVDFAGTLTTLAGVTVTVTLRKL